MQPNILMLLSEKIHRENMNRTIIIFSSITMIFRPINTFTGICFVKEISMSTENMLSYKYSNP